MSRIPAGFVQAVLRGHSALGIAFAAAIYIVCLSGTLAVFMDEFLRWENPDAPYVEQMSPEAVQNAIAQVAERNGEGLEHIYVRMPEPDKPFMRLNVDAAESADWIADSTGNIVAPTRSAWTDFIVRLHIYLHLPPAWGIFIVGLTGVALLSSLISGLLAHPRIFRDAFHLRIGGSRRLQEADLHNRIGVWGLPFHIIVSLSGAFLGLTTIVVGVLGMAMFNGDTNKIYDLFLPPAPVDNPAPAPLLDIAPMFAKLPKDARLERITLEHPTERGGVAIFDMRYDGALAEAEAYGFDRKGSLFYSKQVENYTPGERILGSLGPLHFGWFAGGIVKIAYGLLGLGLTYLAVGGIHIWLVRRRDKGRPAPGWERVWAAVVWGQPLALASSALGAVIWPDITYHPLILTWLGVTLFALSVTVLAQAQTLVAWGRGTTGALLLTIGLIHGSLRTTGNGQALVWGIDILLFGAGILLLASAWRLVKPFNADHVLPNRPI